jgi:hypothetical protein
MAAHPSLVSRDPYFRSIVDARKTAEVDSRVASAGVAARVVAETANASPEASWCFTGIGRGRPCPAHDAIARGRAGD